MTRHTTTSYARLGPRMVAIALAVIGTVALPQAAHAQEPVSYWSGIAKTVIIDMAARGGSPSAVDFAYVHIAIYDAVNAIDKRYTVFAVTPDTFTDDASEPAAVAAAATAAGSDAPSGNVVGVTANTVYRWSIAFTAS